MKASGVRASFAKGNRRRQAMYLIPNLCTTGNLFCGVFAILSVFNGQHLAAAIAILGGMVFDMLDGKLARLTNSTGQFGIEYDSLSDVVSFGVAPGVLIYSYALSGQGMFGVAVMFAYVAMGAVRLARFNATVSTADSKYFTGLAIPAAAGVIASLVIFDLHITQMGAEVKPLLILVITFALAFLMVSTIKYRSFKDLKFRRGDHFTYLVWGILALMMIAAWPLKRPAMTVRPPASSAPRRAAPVAPPLSRRWYGRRGAAERRPRSRAGVRRKEWTGAGAAARVCAQPPPRAGRGQSAASAMRLRFSTPITWSSAASATFSVCSGVNTWPAPGSTR